MLFNSLEFVFFFPLVVVAYYLLPHRYRWLLLLAASYYFYMAWKPAYALLLVLSTFIDYYCGWKMGQIQQQEKRKPYLYLSLISNLGILFSFKYLDFFIGSINYLGGGLPLAGLILPMGISFYTFQTMSYSIDVYRGDMPAEKSFGKFALFVVFFPQLVAGPIERAVHLLPQMGKYVKFNYSNILSGLRLVLWGFFKKVVIAERLAFFVNAVYNDPQQQHWAGMAIGTLFFAFQIYCDFSGYSDIAIGSARVLGVDLMKNFNRPYIAKSISEFWRRWHISLSTWFKDYLYIPLGGNRVIKWRWYYNLFITFLISGLWHGANWTFVAWGALHGFYLVMALITANTRDRIWERLGGASKYRPYLAVVSTFILVLVSWVFFRANTIQDACFILETLFSGFNDPIVDQLDVLLSIQGLSMFKLVLAFFLIAILLTIEYAIEAHQGKIKQFNQSYFAPPAYALAVIVVLMLGVFGEGGEFIYFQF